LEIEDIIAALVKKRVRYLLIGGHASIIHGVPRTTTDIDISVLPSPANLERCISALKNVGMSCDTERVDEILGQGGITFTNDRDVDVLTSLPGNEDFIRLWKNRVKVKYHGVTINVISGRDQARLLKAVGRKRDLEDLKLLERD
jgi:hypothetical protein